MTARKYRTPVFKRYSNYFCTVLRRKLKLIRNGSGQHARRGYISVAFRVAYHLIASILDTIHGFFCLFVVPAIPYDAVERRSRSGIHRGVARTSDGRKIVIVTVPHVKTLVHHPLESPLSKAVVKAIKILPAHLVYNDAYYQFGTVMVILSIAQ